MSNPAVLISIRPEWVEKILSGEKTLEIRKRKPYFPAPFKCYIYCTKGGEEKWLAGVKGGRESYKLNGTVCAEFTCDSIKPILPPFTENEGTCLSPEQIKKYAGDWELWLQAWHISDVKVYYKPMIPQDFSYHACIDRVKAAPHSFVYVNERSSK